MRLPSLDRGRLFPREAAHDGSPVDASWPQDCKPASCGRFVTPGVLAARYGFPKATSSGTKGSISVSEYQGQQWDQADLSKFATACGLKNFTVDNMVGKWSGGGACKPVKISRSIFHTLGLREWRHRPAQDPRLLRSDLSAFVAGAPDSSRHRVAHSFC